MERRTFLKAAGGAIALGGFAGCVGVGDYGPLDQSYTFENIYGTTEQLTMKLEDDPSANSYRISDVFVIGESGEEIFHEEYMGIETMEAEIPGPGRYRCIGVAKNHEEGHVAGKDVVVVEVKENQSVEAVSHEES